MARGSTTPPSGEPTEPARRAAGTALRLPFSITGFRNRLHAWYRESARVLPWRGVKDPYAIWVSEIMLQQTRVATVHDRYIEFIARFPTLRDLAEADENEVLALWSGLGYYQRARLLHRGAQFVRRELKGKLPRTAAELRTLPGVGGYTAAAVASIAFGQSVAVVDGNVERVLLRVLGMPEERSAAARAQIATIAQSLIPQSPRRASASRAAVSPGDHNQAMMELGALVCLPKGPLCVQCPVMDVCKTRGEHITLPREARHSRIVAHLLVLRKRGIGTEVLLERRSQTDSLMPGMLELPSLPLESVRGREPVLRLRHAITDTNYYVQIFAESAPGVAPPPPDEQDSDLVFLQAEAEAAPVRARPATQTPRASEGREEYGLEDQAILVRDSAEFAASRATEDSLLAELSAEARNLEWIATTLLRDRPLTGLARKSLQRLGVMPLPQVSVG